MWLCSRCSSLAIVCSCTSSWWHLENMNSTTLSLANPLHHLMSTCAFCSVHWCFWWRSFWWTSRYVNSPTCSYYYTMATSGLTLPSFDSATKCWSRSYVHRISGMDVPPTPHLIPPTLQLCLRHAAPFCLLVIAWLLILWSLSWQASESSIVVWLLVVVVFYWQKWGQRDKASLTHCCQKASKHLTCLHKDIAKTMAWC